MLQNSLPDEQDQETRSSNDDVYTVLVCGHDLVRTGLARILAGSSIQVSQSLPDIGSLTIPDDASRSLVILHFESGCLEASSSISCLRQRFPDALIVALADQPDIASCMELNTAGAHGIVDTSGRLEAIIKKIELVLLGEQVFPTNVTLALLEATSQRSTLPPFRTEETAILDGSSLKGRNLSEREKEILCLLQQGAPNKIIARHLNVSEATVKVHVKAILRKVGASNRTQAAMWATNNMKPMRTSPFAPEYGE